MIPKIIHYCWLSDDPIPDSLKACMDSWKVMLPDYEFIHWNFDRFPKDKSQWVREAFDNKKYAFAADFIRLYALYHYGGIYLDMDVEVKKSFNPFLSLKTMICWQKDIGGLEVAAFGVEKHSKWVKDCLSYYDNRPFVKSSGAFDIRTLPTIVERQLKKHGYKLINCNTIKEAKDFEKEGVPIFSCEYFSPKSYRSGIIDISENTYSIHKFASSWVEVPKYEQLEKKVWLFLGVRNLNVINKIKWLFIKAYRKFLRNNDW